jgi:hypothetical protein
VVDTPGVRSFGLAHVSANSILHGFPDLVEASVNCPPNCEHTATSPNCGLDALVAAGGADPRRLAEVDPAIRASVDLEVDGGELPGTPSTVVDLSAYEQSGSWSVLREGAVSGAELGELL